MYYTQQEIAEIKEYAQKHMSALCKQYWSEQNQKVYVSDDVYVYDIEGKAYLILLDLYYNNLWS